jgi:glutaconate CoA-transferase, subunit A
VSRLATLDDAVAAIRDGMTVGIGGSVLSRKPMAAVRGLAARGVRGLELVAFTGSLDVELLVGAGAARAVRSSSVSLGLAGPATRFAAAVEEAALEDLEESEWMLLGRLRAAASGMPFLPTRAALGSELVELRGLHEVADPYTGERALAIPPLRLDVALIHAWRADAQGNVQLAWPPDHLWDVDILLARAARRVIVTTDNLVSESEVTASADRTVLFGFEVDAVVETERGAFPTASPPDYEADVAAVAAGATVDLHQPAAAGVIMEENR